ncbi:ferritin-like domain-containing protein [Conexibacter sp. JD483]|uniref:ferritin-like domain-containing protein n=1 Tax=unclassified Conexibacter TaxID=2627773 RepID=UPI002723D477|nr:MULTISPECIES: ferritin-like domain-containing protein [unclassified Conexibacter]MDO8188624.1 ferritin-like domain-containing protein [Conexibacter sp. CPCC 205706]MDO8201540.1 ferritin-like domain-containing protein [Conexibacter sp. CPCC 205762]MDR9370759.1 ferritin-like domain-containing protein [Conexibacter sp. JD483]
MADIHPTLDELDRDGALREAGARVDPITRGSFLRRALAVAGGAAAAGIALPALSPGAALAQSGSDVDILNYALTLEYLEAAFYAEAVSRGALSGELATFARTVAGHERAHVLALQRALGSKAVKRPSFDFKGTTGSQDAFWRTALTLEDTGVEAYQGAAVNIQSRDILTAAISIHPIEARHAAWIASISSRGGTSPNSPAPQPFNPARTMDEVLAVVRSTGFISTMAGATPSQGMTSQPAMTG